MALRLAVVSVPLWAAAVLAAKLSAFVLVWIAGTSLARGSFATGITVHGRCALSQRTRWLAAVGLRWANKRVRRETGKEQVVQVHYDEGVAIRIGPAPCADAREGIGEASAGVCAGQPSSRESGLNSGADAVLLVEGNTEGRAIASARTTRRGRRP
jgi:hypothetical protein